MVSASVVRSGARDTIDQRLLEIAQGGIGAAMDRYGPDAVAVERVFSQNNMSTVMGTAQVSGGRDPGGSGAGASPPLRCIRRPRSRPQ